MFGLLNVFKRGVVGTGIGCLLLAWLIWHGGPMLPFGTYRPLESTTARWVAIAAVFAVWAVVAAAKWLSARRASRQLASAIVGQAKQEMRPGAEATRLRERFEEAIATLQRQGAKRGLYELPWYVFIGPPGSGKTTALVNSGLRFPLEQRGGALRGVGGTRNCDWWFTDEAVFLDTAGRYLTQDSDPHTDAEGWREFLALLRQHRGRRPINGVILTVSAHDLLVQSEGERETYVEAARRRLNEINRELRLQVPVYVLVTKCDLVAGFTEYFDDLTRDGRAQVWGVTFPYERSLAGDAAPRLPAELDALVTRLNERLLARVEDDRDVGRRTRLFAFPQQMAGLRDVLSQFVGDVFASTRFDRQVMLRGVYFTSGTQEGTPIDRLLSAMGQRFGVAPERVAPGTRGKAYFIERLLRDVVFAESGLAGLNRRMELRLAAAQLGAYVAVVAAVLLLAIALSTSYSRNRAYLEVVGSAVAALPSFTDPSAPMETLIDRLDAVRAVHEAATHRDGAPWSMRWGLYQGRAIGNAARDAYARELSALLLPRMATLFEAQLDTFLEPEDTYRYLAGYLMLGERAPAWSPQLLEDLVRGAGVSDDRLVPHIWSLGGPEMRVRPIPIDIDDDPVVGAARNTIQGVSIPELIYRRIRGSSAYDAHAVQLDVALGSGAARVLRRRSGRSLSESVEGLYTRTAFKEIVDTGEIGEQAKYFADEHWVWGEGAMPSIPAGELEADVLEIYEQDYIDRWEGLIDDVTVAQMTGTDVTQGLATLSGPNSPLRLFYKLVDDHTRLVPPPASSQPQSGSGSVLNDLKERIGMGGGGVAAPADPPGTRITKQFEWIHALVAGDAGNALIDRVLGEMRPIQQQLAATGEGLGGQPLTASATVEIRARIQALNNAVATLHPTVKSFVQQVGEIVEGSVTSGGRASILGRYRQEVVAACTDMVSGRYPFVPGAAADVLLSDFSSLFGPGGVFDRFFTDVLAQYVDFSRRPWTWRAGVPFGISSDLPRQFERARDIRDTFFRAGGSGPQLSFTLQPEELDEQVLRFRLQMTGGPVLEYNHGPIRSVSVTWPGADPGPIVATFVDRSGAPPHLSYDGAWAWFRMAEDGDVQQVSAERYVLSLRRSGYTARLRMEMRSVINPFARRDLLQQFPCNAS